MSDILIRAYMWLSIHWPTHEGRTAFRKGWMALKMAKIKRDWTRGI
jgi:hypothetical protein